MLIFYFLVIFLSALSLSVYPTLSTSLFLNSPRNIKVWHSPDPTLVIILWSPPEEPNGKVTGYDILYTDNNLLNNRKWKRGKVNGEITTIVLTKLIPDSRYFLKIKARIDDRELGPPSDVIEFRTKLSSPRSHTSSSKPKILKVVPVRDSSEAEITWRAPQEQKGRIKRYEIYYTSDEKIKQNAECNVNVIEDIKDIDKINDFKQMHTSIYDLLLNTNYKFWIKVKTSEDDVGSTSSMFEYVTKPLINNNKNFFWTCVNVFGLFALCILICSLIIFVFLYFSFKSKQNEAQQKRAKKSNENSTREGLTIS